MQTFETLDPKEAIRFRIAQYSGRVKTLALKDAKITGIVKCVKEIKSEESHRWVITVLDR